MRLGVPGSSFVTLVVAGYQWADSNDPPIRSAWNLVVGKAKDEHVTWDFSGPMLASHETPFVSRWLRASADWIDAGASEAPQPQARLSFTEPNLAFRLSPGQRSDQVRIDVEFDLEFRPPVFGPIYRNAGRPYAVSLAMDSAALRAAADEWDRERASWPDLPDWPPWGTRSETTAWLLRVWNEAAEDLGLTVEPFGQGVLVQGFGAANGTLCVFQGAPTGARFVLWQDAKKHDMFFSILAEGYQHYDRALFIDTLSDWGWYGREAPPTWYSGHPWST